MKNSKKVKSENDNLAQVQGYPDFENSSKGSSVTETIKETINNIRTINEQLDQVYPETQEEEYFFLACCEERLQRMMEDPDFQDESMRMAQFYGR